MGNVRDSGPFAHGGGTMTNFKYIDGDAVLPDAEKVKALRPAAN
jgi:hypothetical protein